MTKIFLIVSVVCNVWFIFLLLYDRIMDTRAVRFLKGIAGLWKSLQTVEKETPSKAERQPAGTTDVVGKSRFKMPPTRTTAAIPTPQAATSEKGEEVSSDDVTFDDENKDANSNPAQVPAEKLDEVFSDIPVDEISYGEDEPDEEMPDGKQATGSSFDDIDTAVGSVRKESPTDEELLHAGKVMSELDGTELFTKITESLTDDAMSERLAKAMAVFVDTVNTVVAQPKKEFVIPDNIEEFDIRKYV